MHRMIMLSAAYQHSSRYDSQSFKGDPENRLFGRMNRRRLEAEAVHDALLAAAGRLDARSGGLADADSKSLRRMLYQKVSRASRSGPGPLFDAPDAAMHVERRSVSTVAPQALFLMNEPRVAEAAGQISTRGEILAQADSTARIQVLYRLLFGRDPTSTEARLGVTFIEEASAAPRERPPGGSESLDPWSVYVQALLLSNEFIFVD
jgi:hypothetical protein